MSKCDIKGIENISITDFTTVCRKFTLTFDISKIIDIMDEQRDLPANENKITVYTLL